MATYAFHDGVAPVPAFGQEVKTRACGTWVVPVAGGGSTEWWTMLITSVLTGDFTIGKGNVAKAGATFAFKLRDRMYLAAGSSFCLSSVQDVTKWEEQDAGAAKISFVSQAGTQDSVVSLATLQGRLAVLGSLGVQIWQVDADPNQLALLQVLDNTGTLARDSVKSVGDFDVMYLHNSGIRSLRAKEVTLNAYVNDIGTAIDLTVRAALVGFDASAACAVVEPSTYQYWLYLNGNIYVLSNYPESKVVAWSTYKATYSLAGVQTAFTPEKFVVSNGQVYVRDTAGKVFQYGGSDNNTYDNCQATVELPWLDLKEPATVKQGMGVDVAMAGAWVVQASMNPRGSLVTVIDRGSTTSPSMTADSTFDIGHFSFSGNGTHIKLKAISGANATRAKLGSLTFIYNPANKK